MEGPAFGRRLKAILENGDYRIVTTDLVRVSAVEAYATFDLTDAPLGTYDFVLERNESYIAATGDPANPIVLDDNIMRSIPPGAFQIVPMVSPEPSFEITVPEELRVGQSFGLVIEVTNAVFYLGGSFCSSPNPTARSRPAGPAI